MQHTPPEHARAPLKGMLFAFFGFLSFSCQDVLMSYTTQFYPPLQMTWINCAEVLLCLLIFLYARKGVAGLRTVFHSSHVKMHIMRGCFLATGTAVVFFGLKHVPLPNFYAVIFIGPLLAVSLSGIFLKEPIGTGKMAALLFGFVGLLFALRPGPEGFNIYTLLILLGAILFAICALITRFLGRMDAASTLIFYPMFIIVVFFFIPVLHGFVPIAPQHIGLCLLTGVFTTFAFFSNSNAYRLAPLYLIAPCQFLQFLWGTIAHYVLHQKLPDTSAVLGAVLIIVSNLVIIYMQQKNDRKHAI